MSIRNVKEKDQGHFPPTEYSIIEYKGKWAKNQGFGEDADKAASFSS
jgi:hypothetical protein